MIGAFTEKMISELFFDKAFISADGYIPMVPYIPVMPGRQERRRLLRNIPKAYMC